MHYFTPITELWTGVDGTPWSDQWVIKAAEASGFTEINGNAGRAITPNAPWEATAAILHGVSITDYDVTVTVVGDGFGSPSFSIVGQTDEAWAPTSNPDPAQVSWYSHGGNVLEFYFDQWNNSIQITLYEQHDDVSSSSNLAQMILPGYDHFASALTWRMRLRKKGNVLYAKVWEPSKGEPDWMLTATTANVGAGSVALVTASGTEQHYAKWDDLTIAPVPLGYQGTTPIYDAYLGDTKINMVY